MEFVIYWIKSENKEKTYIGFSDNIDARVKMHRQHKVKSTKNFGNFSYSIIEKVPNLKYARIQEKYWKSAAGREKLKKMFQ
jgi:putative endonuclease